MSFEETLSSLNNGLSTTLHGVRTAKMASSDNKNLFLLLGGILLGLFLLKKGETK